MTKELFRDAWPVSRETLDRLEALAALLTRWNPRINLVSARTLPQLWTRHFLDSAQLLDLAPPAARHWADLGSGGGFPGLVVAILAAEQRPGLAVTLVESDQRKAAFLQTAARTLGLDLRVVAARIEAVPPLAADILSARALAPLPVLLSHAERHLAAGGTALFPKGASLARELAEALESWRFSHKKIASLTDPDSVILSIGGISRV
ncbi:16S rRNA (guanine(527)-N(7))-methyltransferase RsmG [Albidovulum sp.]